MKVARLVALVAVLAASPAIAGPCESNYAQEGVPMLTAITFKSWQNFSGVDPDKALDRLARAVLAEGFVGMRVDKAYGAITAYQETTGSGREQTLRIVTRKAGNGTRADIVFSIQKGQLASGDTIRGHLCNVLSAAAR